MNHFVNLLDLKNSPVLAVIAWVMKDFEFYFRANGTGAHVTIDDNEVRTVIDFKWKVKEEKHTGVTTVESDIELPIFGTKIFFDQIENEIHIRIKGKDYVFKETLIYL